ncbi:MAG TPA: Rpn family recombination-promoting nuclease/putative transposase [Methanospirillum sp.]|nr:Rpn family recombination-promoting nuclease/putative transposase [Methanospirillum sp.]
MTTIRLPPRIITSGDSYIMSPKNDFAFRLLFGDERNSDLLISLLNAILKERIKSITIKDPHLLRAFFEDKEGILDVRAVTDAGVLIDIEIQLTDYSGMPERILFYWSKMFTSQLSPGDLYHDLKKTISVVILDYVCIPTSGFHSCFHLSDQEQCVTLTEVLEVHILELPKLDYLTEQDKDNPLAQWMQFINASTVEELNMISEANPVIQKAYKKLEVLSQDDETRKVYEAREAALLDRALMLHSAEKAGLEKGIVIGKEEGIAIGTEKGIGLVAANLISLGYDDAMVAKVTGLDSDAIKKIRESSGSG